jgi:hypothetical protein
MSLFDSRLARTKTNHTVHTNIWKTEPADVFTIDQFGFTFSTIFHDLYTQFCCFSLTNIDPLESVIIIPKSSKHLKCIAQKKKQNAAGYHLR